MKKTTKVLVASTLGAALLLGGSTYALWTASVTPESGATITVGTSDLTVLDAGSWIDRGQTDATGDTVAIADINAFRTVPSDNIEYTQAYNLKTAGNANATVSVAFDNDASVGVAALRERGITLTTQILDGEGNQVAVSPADGDTLGASYEIVGATPAAGENFTVQFNFEFGAEVTADDTKNMQVVISNAVVSAAQS